MGTRGWVPDAFFLTRDPDGVPVVHSNRHLALHHAKAEDAYLFRQVGSRTYLIYNPNTKVEYGPTEKLVRGEAL